MDELLAAAPLALDPGESAAGIERARVDALHRLVGDWQLLADLSFADLVLFVPDRSAERFVVVAQMRPLTGPTAYQDDLVGTSVSASQRRQLATALAEGRICREEDPVWVAGVPVREEALPVPAGGRIVAVVTRATNLAAARTPSRLEIAYLRSANELAQMLAEGRWPYPGDAASDGGPRVGDGLIRLDADGVVTFASPNALSAYRRLGLVGDLSGVSLAGLTRTLGDRTGREIGEAAMVLARGSASGSAELAVGDAIVQLRSLPLRPGGEHIGALVLVHDVTDLRHRERALLTKDATIREIHHRVKNNLQTVAALLRLQARRMAVPEARDALEESVRRVSSIAVVHETLTGTLDEAMSFDEVADRVLAMVAEVSGTAVKVERDGSFGVLPAEVATPLAMALSELVHNAVEHGYGDQGGGQVDVVVDASAADRLTVAVVD
ncbi:MAG TPA: sensor histidine kinase, partial [Mycobacteriales bacterium]|nr:sensor histidine kinase [Mycobacteriales bacterium]